MLRSIFSFSIVLVSFVVLSRGLAYQQDKPKIQIEGVTHAKVPGSPHLFDAKGTVTIPPQTRGKDNFVVLVYVLLTDEGGYIQLQMTGQGGSQRPRKDSLTFDTNNTATWRMRIWLGDKDKGAHSSYTVFAVVVKAIDDNDGQRLINLANPKYTEFRDIESVLRQAGFQPQVWTEMKGVLRNE